MCVFCINTLRKLLTHRYEKYICGTWECCENGSSKSLQSCSLLTEALTTLTHHDKTFKSLLISLASAQCECTCVRVWVSDGEGKAMARLVNAWEKLRQKTCWGKKGKSKKEGWHRERERERDKEEVEKGRNWTVYVCGWVADGEAQRFRNVASSLPNWGQIQLFPKEKKTHKILSALFQLEHQIWQQSHWQHWKGHLS